MRAEISALHSQVSMKLISTSLFSGFSTLAKMLAGFIILKVVAVNLGPNGLAFCGQFLSLINIMAVLAGGGISYGIIRYVAEYARSEKKLKFFLSHISTYVMIFSFPTMILGFIFNKSLSILVFGSTDFTYAIIWISISQWFLALNLVLISILNGFKRIKLLTMINVAGAFIGLVITFFLVSQYQLPGALLAIIAAQTTPLIISIFCIFREKWAKYLLNFRFNRKFFMQLSHYSVMNIVSILTVPVAQIIVRNDLSHVLSWQAVGYWQAVLRVSDAYLLLVTTALTAYYLPRLAELKDNVSLKKEMWQTSRIILPAIFIISLAIYLLRDIILIILYTPEFTAASGLFLYQLIGDFFRITGWLCTFLLLAKAWTKVYIATEIILSGLFVIISHFMVRSYGLIGITYSFATTYFLYWLLMLGTSLLYFRKTRGQSLTMHNEVLNP